MLNKKDTFIVRKKYRNQIQKLSDRQQADLLRCVFLYQLEWEYECNDWVVCMLLDIMIDDRKSDDEKYLDVCERNRDNWKLWWRPRKNHKNPVGLSKPKKADNDSDSDIWLLSKDNNVDTSTEWVDCESYEFLYDAYPFKSKWIDKQVCDKLIDKQIKQWATLNWMLKEMKLEELELRINQWLSFRFGKKFETRIKEYVEWMADSEDRLKKLLLEHRKRIENWPPYKKNPRDELCSLFWTDCVKRLFVETKQWVKLFTT